MKPFNLEQALAGAPVITREGTEVSRLFTVPEAKPNSRLVAVLEDGEIATFNEGGRYYSMRDSSLDLFMAPAKKEGWVVMYHNNSEKDFIVGTKIWASKQDAEIWSKGCGGVFAIAKIEWEE